jgi:hypothetical protein
MSGQNKGVYGFIKREESSTYFAGCPCHLIHIAAKNAAKTLPVNMEDVLIDTYYYLKHSAKRQMELKELQGKEKLKVLKHVPTRWLSVKKCLDRLLHLRKPLRDYFREEMKDDNSRPAIVYKFLSSHTSMCYSLFLSYALEMFDKANLTLQAEKPLIHRLRRILRELYRTLLIKFLKPVAFSGTELMEIKLKTPYHQKEEVVLGEKTRDFIKEKKVSDDKVKQLSDHAREFYKVAANYIAEKLPIKEELLLHAEVFDLERLPHKNFSSVTYFTDRFPALKPSCTMDELEEQFSNLQIEVLNPSIHEVEHADEQWAKVGDIKNAAGQSKYKDLVKVAHSVMLIPHSNACCERVFSNVRKIRTDFRSSMHASTLDAICRVKMQMQTSNEACFDGKFSKEETQRAKKCLSK